jgi:hypothetical protein
LKAFFSFIQWILNKKTTIQTKYFLQKEKKETMLLVPFVSTFMVAVVVAGFNIAVLVTAGMGVYYIGYPLVQYISMVHIERFDIVILTIYAAAIATMIFKIEGAAYEFERSFTDNIALKDARIRELEMELNKTRIEEGHFMHQKELHELSNPIHRMCNPTLFQRE